MDNTDAIIYTKIFIDGLDKEGLFNERDPFLDKDILYDEILKMAEFNIIELGEPTLEIEQFDKALENTRKIAITETFDDLINDGMLQMSGLNKDGEFLYSLSEPPDNILELKNKKNKKK
jgi:hypothetical protein